MKTDVAQKADAVSPRGRYIVPALAHGLTILSLFSRERTRLTAPAIAQELQLPRTTVFRLLQTLQAMGYVRRDADERHFRLGPALLGGGFAYIASLDFIEVAQPILQRLRDATTMSTHMAVRDGRDVVYVARFAALTTVRSSVTVGTRFPLHATVLGRMLICRMSDSELVELFPDELLPSYSAQTPASRTALAAMLAEDRKRGYATSQSFFERGVSSVAAPVFDSGGRVVAAINATSVDATVEQAVLNGAVKDAVLAASAEITRWLSQDASDALGRARHVA